MAKKSNFERYKDPSGELSNKELKMGEWYVSHKLFLRKLMIGLLGGWVVLTLGYSLIVIGEYLIFGLWDERDMRTEQTLQFQNFVALRDSYTAESLSPEAVKTYRSGPGKYDLVSAATNNNRHFVAFVRYHYTYGGGRTDTRQMTILPGQRQLLAALGEEMTSAPRGATLVLDAVRWRRLNPHAVPDPESYIAQRVDFPYEDVEIVRGSSDEEGVPTSKVTFTITNNSVYSYWEPEFFVEVLRGTAVEAVLPLSVPGFLAGQTREIDLRSFADIGAGQRIRLTPVLDPFDAGEYMPVGS